MKKKDNSTLRSKISLRKNVLKEIESPVIMETHGGKGVMYSKCYKGIGLGVVFEKNIERASYLAKQRATWSIYETDCVKAITDGVGSHLPVNFFDLDPYGTPWWTIAAIFDHWVYLPSKFAMVVTDGQRPTTKLKGAWYIKQFQSLVAMYGNDQIYHNYVELCGDLFEARAATRGYSITKWTGYYCGVSKDITHMGAVLERN